ncbi:hypothetical protein GCM10007415_42930 [Parapedobacter pyrenivorans]|uniref:Uncharacterized protein n=1 Tax=Parapedobacter pyrenivorans TaxID=1305674 RepID=A0A917MGY5_9SPHI|nr:hypothetical protein [Parapedobacter pyrenivorans]GGH02181.1 hypothetical protein GCM10007415_42930 [Parapedobacter pyrenivorans]
MNIQCLLDQNGFYSGAEVQLFQQHVDRYWRELSALELPEKYPGVKLTPIRNYDWGRECFLHDPSGILWYFGTFSKG